MTNYSIEVQNLVKFFGRRLIFNDINYSFNSSTVYGISGPNGSGKSTFVKILSCIISPTKGKVVHKADNKIIEEEKLHNHIGFVSPYLFLYDEFTAEENLIHFSKIRGKIFEQEYSNFLLNEFNLLERKNDQIKGYSSGMKQRLKFVFALLHNPEVLIFDEPTSNLDNNGKEKVYEFINKLKKEKLIIIASNEDTDLSYCEKILELEKYKNK
ncbi:ABC transporter ATP-binding protein [Stygiobacter electus]|uniref:ABC transporter ATP-binding protein n=1 Tax=Stygiobacter electus TaxID=3032292 RepID=A0AAE3NZ85_9BACT|nr:ABC transporter ATP-binding protein [Stygiobacter electus]MDF1611330.1 ABC transporter ATP-binding protein [Stygiobacter electus]